MKRGRCGNYLSGIVILVLLINFSSAIRLPIVGGDSNSWGDILNTFLNVSHNETGELRENIISTNNIIDGTITDDDLSNIINFTTLGDVGIGTTTPTAKLEVVGSISYNQSLNKIFVFEGDSLTNRSTPAASNVNWVANITHDEAFFADGKKYIVATSGQSIATIVTQYTTQIHPLMKSKLNDDAYLFIWAGTNDLSLEDNHTTIYNNLKTEWANARADGFKVIAFTIISRDPSTYGGDGASAEANRTLLNSDILSDSSLYDYLIRTDLLFPTYTDTNYFSDGIHLTELGNDKLADYIKHNLFSNRYSSLNYLNGKIGIGTVNPSSMLEVIGNTYISEGFLYINGTIDGKGIVYENASGYGRWIIRGTTAETGSNLGYGLNFASRKDDGTSLKNVMTLQRTGNVGIGTTSPNALLTVNGNTNLSGQVNITGDLFVNGINISNIDGGINYWGSNGSNIYNMTAYVGIGTTNPTTTLDVNGDIFSSGGSFKLNGTIDGTGYYLYNTSNSLRWMMRGITAEAGSNSGYGLNFASRTDTGEVLKNVLTLQREGNIGMGISIPKNKLQVQNSGEVNVTFNTNGEVTNASLFLTEGTGTTPNNNGVQLYYDGSANSFKIATGTTNPFTDRLTILRDTGNVGIGTTSPATLLEVNSSSSVDGIIKTKTDFVTRYVGYETQVAGGNYWFAGSDGALGDYYFNVNATTRTTSKLLISPSGNVGIGTTSPNARLTVNGNTNLSGDVNITGDLFINNVNNTAPDFVFEKNYTLKTLKEVEDFTKENKHLPWIKSAEELKNSGINAVDFNFDLLESIENLWLHSFEQEKKIVSQNEIINSLQNKLNTICKENNLKGC